MAAQTMLLKTPLNPNHQAHGAKLVEFGGWEMPLQFGKVLDEHHAVRKACGLFDICHMGLLSFSAASEMPIRAALNALVPQDLEKLYPGKAVYTQLLNEQGGILDDIIVYQLPPTQHFSQLGQFLIICNAANSTKVQHWIKSHLPQNIEMRYQNGAFGLIALQGPAFQDALQQVGLEPSAPLPKRFHIAEYSLAGMPVLLSRTGYTGEDGVEILTPVQYAGNVWETLLSQGQSTGIKPIGLAARDTLRLEAAYPLHGAELTETITPLEAGLDWSVKLGQDADFIGKAALLKQQQAGLEKHFVCLEVLKNSIPRHHDPIFDAQGEPLGEITSGSISPTLGKPIGVGYITTDQPPAPGSRLLVGIRGNKVEAQVVARPFYRK